MNYAQRWFLFFFSLTLLTIGFFFIHKATADWTVDTEPPDITLQISCTQPGSTPLGPGNYLQQYQFKGSGQVAIPVNVDNSNCPTNPRYYINLIMCTDGLGSGSGCKYLHWGTELVSISGIVENAGTPWSDTINSPDAFSRTINTALPNTVAGGEAVALYKFSVDAKDQVDNSTTTQTTAPSLFPSYCDISGTIRDQSGNTFAGTYTVTGTPNGSYPDGTLQAKVTYPAPGQYKVSNLTRAKDYTITLAPQSTYSVTSPNPVTRQCSPPAQDFTVNQNTISGNVYTDDTNQTCSGIGDGLLPTPFTVTPNVGTASYPSAGTYSVTNLTSGTYNVTMNIPTGYILSPCNTGTLSNIVLPPSPQTNKNFYVVRAYSISGNVFVDYNHNALPDTAGTNPPDKDAGINNIPVAVYKFPKGVGAIPVQPPQPTDSSGNYKFSNLPRGTYIVEVQDPVGYTSNYVPNTPQPPVTLAGNNYDVLNVNFSITPLYTVSGNIFNDTDKDGIKDATETNYTATPITITPSGPSNGTSSYVPTGTYLINGATGLISGTYTIAMDPGSATGYTATTPLSFQIKLGESLQANYLCTVPSADPDPRCVTGSMQTLNFGLSNSCTWTQSVGEGYRTETGNYQDCVPNPPVCQSYATLPQNTTTNPGVINPGANSFSFCSGFGSGGNCQSNASSTQWVASGFNFEPATSGVIRTSYSYLETTARQSNITINEVNDGSCFTNGGCNFTSLNNSGVYRINPDPGVTEVYIKKSKVDHNMQLILLVNANVHIKDTITVDPGSSLTLSASGDIIVEPSVGTPGTNAVCPAPGNGSGKLPTPDPTNNACDLQGFFSTDHDFIIDGINKCSLGEDRQLCIAGGVVANAGIKGGAVVNRRDLCVDNKKPSVIFESRPDFILNSPDFIKHYNFVWQEIAP